MLNNVIRITLAMGFLCLLMACRNEPAPPYSASFIKHLKSNAPAGGQDCIVAATLARWPNEAALYAAADARRVTRGETDAVNFAIGVVARDCEPGHAAK